eukprot:54605-Eustigmatos_ZCMA.PRE.1
MAQVCLLCGCLLHAQVIAIRVMQQGRCLRRPRPHEMMDRAWDVHAVDRAWDARAMNGQHSSGGS